MSKLNIELPAGSQVCNGKLVTFKAPCNCSSIIEISVGGVDYLLVDSLGNTIDLRSESIFAKDSYVSMILDAENKKAYLMNTEYQKPWNVDEHVGYISPVGSLSVSDSGGTTAHPDDTPTVKSYYVYMKNSGSVYLEFDVKDNGLSSDASVSIYVNENLIQDYTLNDLVDNRLSVKDIMLSVTKGDILSINASTTGMRNSSASSLEVSNIRLKANVETPYVYHFSLTEGAEDLNK